MQRIFVHEFLSGSPAADLGEAEAWQHLLPQGVAMRDAMLADLCALPGLEISAAVGDLAGTAWPPGLRAVAGSTLRAVSAEPGENTVDFVRRQARDHDLAWVVAPETGGMLAALQAVVPPLRWLGCDAASLRTASSKSGTLAVLAARGIATPLAFTGEATRWVVKPDDGAGAVDTRVHGDRASALAALAPPHAAALTLEPFVEGEALSITLLAGAGWVRALAFNRQQIEIGPEGRLAYRGVQVFALDPLQDPRCTRLHLLALEVARALPGLFGFVGIDLVWHDGRGPVVIEVNPRLTSAYVGLSAALGRNCAAELLQAHAAAQAVHV